MTSIYGNNIPIGAEVLLRNGDSTLTSTESCSSKGWNWTTGTPSGDVCLSPCPSGYTASWDKIHGAVCNKIGDSTVNPDGTETTTNTITGMTSDDLIVKNQLTANAQKQNTDVFKKETLPSTPSKSDTGVLLDLGRGIKIDTTGAIALIALFYIVYTRKS